MRTKPKVGVKLRLIRRFRELLDPDFKLLKDIGGGHIIYWNETKLQNCWSEE